LSEDFLVFVVLCCLITLHFVTYISDIYAESRLVLFLFILLNCKSAWHAAVYLYLFAVSSLWHGWWCGVCWLSPNCYSEWSHYHWGSMLYL